MLDSLSELLTYFQPSEAQPIAHDYAPNLLPSHIEPQGTIDVAIVGVDSSFVRGNVECNAIGAADLVRRYLMALPMEFSSIKLRDLGDLRSRNPHDDPSAMLTDVIETLFAQGIIPIVIGGSHFINLPIFRSLASSAGSASLAFASSSVPLSPIAARTAEDFIPTAFDEIVADSRLRSLDLLAYQNYLTSRQNLTSVDGSRCYATRLASVQDRVQKIEPIMRDADIFAISASAVRSSDLPAQLPANPNGLFAHEICHLAKLAGLADRCRCLTLTDLQPQLDTTGVSAALYAQTIWHFLQGIDSRYGDYPARSDEAYKQHVVFDPLSGDEIRFFTSEDNGRWWIRIPRQSGEEIFACNESDYDAFLRREVPDVWYRWYKK